MKRRSQDDEATTSKVASIEGESPLDDLLEDLEEAKRNKRLFNHRQRRSSLLIDYKLIDDDEPMKEFASLYNRAISLATDPDHHKAHLSTISAIIKESIIVEWPRSVNNDGNGSVLVDQSPLLHRSRTILKTRNSHPTMRVKVFAMEEKATGGPALVEILYRCTLVKLSGEVAEAKTVQMAGRLILTQREGPAAPRITEKERLGVTATPEGRLLASQTAGSTENLLVLTNYGEKAGKGTTGPLKYENGVACATFPEVGLTLNVIMDRRLLSTRYAIQVEVGINIDNKLLVNHTVFSHPFLIAITNEQNEPLLSSLVWSRLLDHENADGSEAQLDVPWRVLRKAVVSFPKSQTRHARGMVESEVDHFQAMLFSPQVAKAADLRELRELFHRWFPHLTVSDEWGVEETRRRLREALASGRVEDDVAVAKGNFMLEKCVSLIDGTTQLPHTPWMWLYRAAEIIVDIGHKLSPSPAEKRSSRTKRQLAALDEYHSMGSLFNRGLISFCSLNHAKEAFLQDTERNTMLVRFCDENAGYLSFCYGLKEGKLVCGSVEAETLIREFKQGLPEALVDERKPRQYNFFLCLDAASPQRSFQKIQKKTLFGSYQSLRLNNKAKIPRDSETIRIDPLSGVAESGEEPVTPPAFLALHPTSPPSSGLTPLLQNVLCRPAKEEKDAGKH